MDKHEKKIVSESGYFALIPFSVFIAYNGFIEEGLLSFLLALPICYAGSMVVYMLFSDFYYQFNYIKRSSEKPISLGTILFQIVGAVIVSYFVMAWLASM